MQGTTVQRGLKYGVLSCVLAIAAAGCDAQAATDYRGESLLSVTGSVEIPETADGL